MMTGQDHFYISSRLVKEVVSLGGDVSSLVPPIVAKKLKEKF
jgi:pantetheine-phosphate adenylyltransferase